MKPNEARRINVLFIFFSIAAFLIVARFAYLQIIRPEIYLGNLARAGLVGDIGPERGEIFVRDRFSAEKPLAINKAFFLVYAEPDKVEDPGRVANALSGILNLDRDELFKKITKQNDPYEVIAQKVPEDIGNRIKELDLKGVKLSAQKWRYYPYENMAAHISGFVGMKGDEKTGQYGVEGFYDDELKSGWTQKLILSLNPEVQFKIEEKLKEMVEKWGASGGSVVVIEPSTGRLLGLANYPDFNPNEYAKVEDISFFKNSAVSDQFELGSVFKPITMAMGMEEKAVAPDTTYEDKGIVSIGSWYIQNSDGKAYGTRTMTQVLERSLNTGVVFVQQKISKDNFKKYVKNFGFGDKTGVDLSGEAAGDTRNLKTNGDIEFANMSFGQGIAVTPIQMISAISALANGGVLMKPRVVDEKIYADGERQITPSIEAGRVVSKETALALTKMLVSVVENGYDKAKVPGYLVAGKTGTAQIPEKGKKGYSEDTIHTFVGYAPAYSPRFSVLIKLDRPRGVRFAAESLTPVFSDIMSYLLSYYEVPPDLTH